MKHDNCIFVTKHSYVTTLTSNNSMELLSPSHQLSKFYETRTFIVVYTASLLSVIHQIHQLYVLLPYFFNIILIYFICFISFWNSALSREVPANAGVLGDKAAVLGPVTRRPCVLLPFYLNIYGIFLLGFLSEALWFFCHPWAHNVLPSDILA